MCGQMDRMEGSWCRLCWFSLCVSVQHNSWLSVILPFMSFVSSLEAHVLKSIQSLSFDFSPIDNVPCNDYGFSTTRHPL
ncbi:hypothetical protein XENTR_v10020684 [Xenopus tropicalis]|nr:hypothetical protein XENTR_v10020682 [Xenopus tropicalis]KAE8583782.1 hypothetical protein XENTR_v10020684 [Xenopus tropicalis]